MDIGGNGDMEIALSTNAFKVQAMTPSGITGPGPQVAGTLSLTGLGSSPMTMNIYALGILRAASSIQVLEVTDFVTAAVTIRQYWTYNGLYDASSGDWVES
jgi:hypothetical protein